MEIQAVVMAGGRGTRIPQIISERPKCLLPIGPYPLLWYPLNMLCENGFEEVIVIVLESQKNEIQQTFDKIQMKIKIEYSTIPSDSDYGTADSIKHIKDILKTDVLIVSCDLITNVALLPLLTDFRKNNASLGVFLFNSSTDGIVLPGPKNINKPERDLICLDPVDKRILFLGSTSDFDETVNVPGNLLRTHKKACVYSHLIDSHIYIIKKWLIDFLVKEEGISTIKGEFIPYVVKKQMARSVFNHSTGFEKAYANVNTETNANRNDIFGVSSSGKVKCRSFDKNQLSKNITVKYADQPELDKKIINASLSGNSGKNDQGQCNSIKCFASLAANNTFAIRVNTIQGFCAANQKILSHWETFFAKKATSTISQDSVIKSNQVVQSSIAAGSIISEKSSLSKCVIGMNCKIHPKVRLSNCILMNDVTIEEGNIIENSILCENSIVQNGCTLKQCLIAPNFIAPKNLKNEKVHLTSFDEFMEIE